MKTKLITLAILIAASTLQAAPRNLTVKDYFSQREQRAFLNWTMDFSNIQLQMIWLTQVNYLAIFADVWNKPVSEDYLDRTGQNDRSNNPTAPAR